MQYIAHPRRKQNNDKRIEYIDAMRGLAMFMVVVSHVFTICTLTCIYIWLCNADFYNVISSNMKFGYWFTLVLFGFTIIYLAVYKLLCFMKNPSWRWVLILASAIFITLLSSFLTNKYNSFSAIGLISIPQYQYYIYFVLGSICFHYREKVFSMKSAR